MTKALEVPPVLLLFDISAVLATELRDWQAFRRVGECYLPQAVQQELQDLSQHAIEKSQESRAREFLGFLERGVWQWTDDAIDHPLLQPAPGHGMSKRARLALAVSRCAHGFAQYNSHSLVVLVTNEPIPLQGLQSLHIPNLCLIATSALLTWSRTDRRPTPVAQQILTMRHLRSEHPGMGQMTAFTTPSNVAKTTATRTPTTKTAVTHTMPDRKLTSTGSLNSPRSMPQNPRSSSTNRRHAKPDRYPVTSTRPNAIRQLWSGFLALSMFVLLGGTVWYLFHPRSFNQFLRDRGLPPIPPLISHSTTDFPSNAQTYRSPVFTGHPQ
ncbi:PIN domain-containing protein [Alkalinema pantanalense CENA528]|uniref:PIN domain-containing protein n=1 Tax=Alkalinema pantanalense TaxID=1620705 RepID=UPI003D6ECC30